MPTIREVAEACGVSPMTVSFVLNNRPGQVSSATRDRVLQTVRDMGYRPAATQAREKSVTNTIGVVAGVPTDSLVEPGYYSRVILAALRRADVLRQNITLFSSNLLHADTHRSIRVYCDGRCEGLLVVAPGRNSELLSALQERGTPYLVVGSSPDNEDIPWCDVDNVAEMCKVTDYLIAMGHRRFAFCGGPDFVESAHQRYAGFLKAMSLSGIPHDPAFSMIDIHIEPDVYQWITQMLKTPLESRPTALVAWNDKIAVVAMHAAHDLGLNIPADLSITGFDNDDRIVAEHPLLTTVRQPYERIGGGSIEMLLAQIEGEVVSPMHRVEAAELIVRGSAAPPKVAI